MTGPNAGTDNALDNAQGGQKVAPEEMLSARVCLLLLKRSGKDVRYVGKIRAIEMDEPFAIETTYGYAKGDAGDFLINDGGFDRIRAETFKRNYAPFRKPREKKEDK